MSVRWGFTGNYNMDPAVDLSVQVITSNGSSLRLDSQNQEDAETVLKALTDGGFIVLKNAASFYISSNYTENLMLQNPYVESILKAVRDAQGGTFEVFHRRHLIKPTPYNFGRMENSAAEDPRLIKMSCDFLGGGEDCQWTVHVDKNLRGSATGDFQEVEMNAWDIFICNGWLHRTNPRPRMDSGQTFNEMVIKYRWVDPHEHQ